ncbi:hypothetical protein [Mycobacterium intracellulare]|uniref:hypothetical protein n=1 Tax=Mycobacterium intracellulare TaxID=1767 RepID=UPI0003D22E38|nr:hypothetical protein [Mycobacterium intracellulare]ETA92402.1 hypothetical protein O982_23655 [Mycobacterium avium 10-5581]
MEPFVLQASDTAVEIWSGYRIQYDGEERHHWQKVLKAKLKQAFIDLAISPGVPFVGYYDTTNPAIADTENSLFTNFRESMPKWAWVRFEHGPAAPPAPPIPIDLIAGHLHYYRYSVGTEWTRWQPDQTVARWQRIPRRLALNGSARPTWYALREANANGLISLSERNLDIQANFGLRLTVHATKHGPHNAISCSEELIDGTIAAFHDDRYTDALASAAAPKFPGITTDELRRALDHPVGPLISSPAIRVTRGGIQISPADEHCRVGELIIRPNSTSPWSELSGELFTIRRRQVSPARCE